MSPAEKKRAKELYPAFYAERKKLLKQQTKNLYDLARIKLHGIESFDDLKKTYLAETGRLDVGPLENLLNPELVNLGTGAKRDNQARFERGLANPFSVFGKEPIPMNVSTRREQSEMWADRRKNTLWSTGTKLGVEDTGFPPFSGSSTNRGDQAWYQVLRNGINA